MSGAKHQKETRRARWATLVPVLALLVWVATNTLFHAAAPQFINPVEPLKRTIFKYAFQTVLASGPTLLMLAIGYGLASAKQHRNYQLVAYWLLTVGTGLALTLAFLLKDNQFALATLYNDLLPLTRNAYPFVSGFLLGLLTLPVVQRVTREMKTTHLVATYVALFLGPTLFNQDVLNFSQGTSTVFYWLIFAVGVALHQMPPIRQKKRYVLGLSAILVVALGLIFVMPYVSYNIYSSQRTGARFAHPASFFVLTSLVGVFYPLAQRFRQSLSVLSLTTIVLTTVGLTKPVVSQTLVDLVTKWSANSDWRIFVGSVLVSILYVGLVCLVAAVGLQLTQTLRAHWQKKLDGKAWFVTPTELKRFVKRHAHLLGFAGVLYVLTVASFLLMNFSTVLATGIQFRRNVLFFVFFYKQGMILLTFALLLALFGILRAVTNRFWISAAITVAFISIFTIASRIKLQLRGEPIYPSEVDVATFPSLLGMVPLATVLVGAVALLALIALVVFLERKHSRAKMHWWSRGLSVLVGIVLLASPFSLNTEGSRYRTLFKGFGNEAELTKQAHEVKVNGPVIQFMNNMDITIMDEVDGYSKSEMQRIAEKYAKLADQTNQTRTESITNQNVVFVLSESFTDLSRVPELSVTGDTLPYIRQLKTETTAGLMMSSGFGGGTANMEYMTLTGFSTALFSPTASIPYSLVVPSQESGTSINQAFARSIAIHPFNGLYYSRISAYKKLGFDSFRYLGSPDGDIAHKGKIKDSEQLSDRTAYLNALDALKESDDSTFINLVTMQNHMPYNNWYGTDGDQYQVSGATVGDAAQANTYAAGIHYTDEETKEFIAALDELDKPVTVVFYGDHLPGFLALDESQYSVEAHQTDYFVYANAYARAHGSQTKITDSSTSVVAPGSFPALLFEQSNAKVDGYTQLLTEMQQKLPALSVGTGSTGRLQFTTADGKAIPESELTDEQKEILRDYRLVQYDITTGNQYLLNTDFMTYYSAKGEE